MVRYVLLTQNTHHERTLRFFLSQALFIAIVSSYRINDITNDISLSTTWRPMYRNPNLGYSNAMDIYHSELTDHYRNPRNKGTLAQAHFASEQYNPSCGDMISWQGRVQDGAFEKLAFEGKGCVISQGTASLLSVALTGAPFERVKTIDSSYILRLIGLELGPTRLRCALLPLEALRQGIDLYQKSLNQ